MSGFYSQDSEWHQNEPVDEAYWRSILSEDSSNVPHEDSTAARDGSSAVPAPRQQAANDWQEAARLMAEDSILTLEVTGFNRGGLLVNWRSLRGFVPASQLVNYVPHNAHHNGRSPLEASVGEHLKLRIIEIDPHKNRLILSERAAQVERGARHRLLQAIQPGDIVHGRITNLVEFGAFADLGGVEGLIHISELSWGRVTHPSDLLKRGQTVQLYVMDVDPAATRIALSMKRLRPDPWATVEQRYTVGEIIEAVITNVVDFGAFACVEEGLEGLIHFSELAEGHFLHPRNVVTEGQHIRARILNIDGKARRLGLTLRLT
ncbi:30S ribosomal protein S1 [Fischerella thermalis CCMEE 5330]|uniref:30S ribosomal protein S1 n=1 Tax=Fischerella thermalis CCMEE 5330 TaxID=2019670 RepID=A0A2N6MNF7_9CYAN|nr:30S ribosomal protein S1 [Fischerella thermalis CCMEE 5330]